MPLAAILSTRAARRDERVRTDATALCRRGEDREQVRVLDLSRHGARFQTVRRLTEGQRIWIRLPMLESLEAKVVWIAGDEAGCEFAVPLHPAIFATVSQAARSRR